HLIHSPLFLYTHSATIYIYTLSLHDALPILDLATYAAGSRLDWHIHPAGQILLITEGTSYYQEKGKPGRIVHQGDVIKCPPGVKDRKSTRLNSSHVSISYAVFCLKKKNIVP